MSLGGIKYHPPPYCIVCTEKIMEGDFAMKGIIEVRARHWFLAFTGLLLVGTIAINREIAPASAADSFTVAENGARVIIIDPGHGGFDGGAVGVNGTIEKDVNLAVSLKLRDMLNDAGFSVVMTRDSDRALNDSEDTSVRRKKISDMRNRLNLTRLYPGSVLISIHQNKLAGSSSVRGAQIFYSPNEAGSKELAQFIQTECNAKLQPEKPREIVKTGKNLYLFYHAQNTAVLCECGFLSNQEEEALLSTDEYQYKVAYCIFSGLLRWNESKSTE